MFRNPDVRILSLEACACSRWPSGRSVPAAPVHSLDPWIELIVLQLDIEYRRSKLDTEYRRAATFLRSPIVRVYLRTHQEP